MSRWKKQLAALGPVPEIVGRIPRPYPQCQKKLGDLVSIELRDVWETTLSDVEVGQLRQKLLASRSAIDKLDALILKETETMGWRLGLSELVHMRFSEWEFEPNGATLFSQYGKALAKSARRLQKKERLPIDDPQLYLVKQKTVGELRLFLRDMRNAFSGKRTGPTFDQLADFFEKAVSAEDSAFRHLKVNLDSWIRFFRTDPASIRSLLLGKRAFPATLFDSWFSWSKGSDPEIVRRKISGLGRFVRNHSQTLKL